jgi:hypothetical protein
VEIKTGHYSASDLRGLFEFCRPYPAIRLLVLSAPRDEEGAKKYGVSAVSWRNFPVLWPAADKLKIRQLARAMVSIEIRIGALPPRCTLGVYPPT